ncbi:MAG: type II toxin-antitoxin system Phd/YefM family antitoxin [Clostridia bacterium]|nr:type II toxin-antitoxin system Phd/YefM family antitoxin [Clostridia bacterium]
MTNINITNFRKDIYELLEQTIKYNEPINVSTKNGNAVILSEEDYNNLMETLYISSIPKLKEDIIEGLNEPIEDCIDEEEVKW